ncbi:DUF2975 domain-containing protein [uncultured Brevundimonas sp.]|uniref:DUF2975 domain-containing protein n=1 Tax=uncultured Brevundimonas sp. TaxID=213418 RepID=UPI002628F72E|nr:DUF2975 domain-containing protein [uncultured Brevundimonas sp.]
MPTGPGPIAKRLPRFKALSLYDGPAWAAPTRLLKSIIDIAYAASICLTILFAIVFVISIFLPLTNFSIAIEDGANTRQMPLTRTLVLFVVGVVSLYFSGFVFILRNLRQLFLSMLAGDAFRPGNVVRLRLVGLALGIVTLIAWCARTLIAKHLAVGAISEPSVGEFITPAFAIFITLTLAELFREGARLRRETELTI